MHTLPDARDTRRAARRVQVRIGGVVQGVGFRPFIYRLARQHGLSGYVLNDGDGVLAEIEGASLDGFLAALRAAPPPLARIERVDVHDIPPDGGKGFEIRETIHRPGHTRMAADAPPCPSCLQELFDPASRFYLYPFISCTQCGPRLTITRALPFDRANTTMSAFSLCPDCRRDYQAPGNRRFHAETIACASCGPRLSASTDQIANALCDGAIVALKGVGGFHLYCDAGNEAAVRRLRVRKNRPAKPFATLVADLATAGLVAIVDPLSRRMLERPERPIVLLARRTIVAPSVAPGLRQIGVMLPSAPIHHLLFHALAQEARRRGTSVPACLVATSANRAGMPLITDNGAAHAQLAGLADLIVTHDRDIENALDDSVMTVIDRAPACLRRARGIVPAPVDLAEDGPPVLAVGAYQKATICITRGREAFLSQHIGDLDSPQAIRRHADAIRRMTAFLGVVPLVVACDLHPDYPSSRYAQESGMPVLPVQHHLAHLAAVAAERIVRGPYLGLALDGHGHGRDGGNWGGELLHVDGSTWHRLGHLAPVPLPGGDRAAREPWRMGVAVLATLGRRDEAGRRFHTVPQAARLAGLVTGGAFPGTSSMGRLFDAAAALLGICIRQSHEAEAAMALEALATTPRGLPNGYRLNGGTLDFLPLLAALSQPGMDARTGADLFHGTVIAGLSALTASHAARLGVRTVLLAGGCLANRLLADGLAGALRNAGLNPIMPRSVPANDGGLSLGQAAWARLCLKDGTRAGIPGYERT
ncbi:carbamoyltransferase HypF [Nguyenibacter vanlangensis]|uniref:Carbamoyltransferase HypF n=1 Tax=Nguyenibacter vanlangensis TaxID=1216886 RepID=A0A7Y7ITD8_9PROT|nr:carbamoyltransferase HypF [Nguyenibacter vanlangensis]NVN10019.1 carbamoyltransferase HypF [Nguyenibacter vanlangensis]